MSHISEDYKNEYSVTDGITDPSPLFTYSYNNDTIVKNKY
jgi:hypothetical protein